MSDLLAEDRIADLLLAWEKRFERGEDMYAAELCADRPDLIPRLAARIDLLRTVAWVNRPPISDSERGAPLRPPTEPLAGRYRLDALIGQGGYGQVWRGFDLELQGECTLADWTLWNLLGLGAAPPARVRGGGEV
jgi:hypothetical protein